MKAINYHIRGIITSFEQLSKGKYLVYFIPGVVLTLIFWYFQSKITSTGDSVNLHSSYGWIDWMASWLNYFVKGTFGFFALITEQIYIFAVLTLLSPFFTSLGETMDKDLTGNAVNSGFMRFINDMIRMVFVVLLMVIMELFFMGFYAMISWIFGFNDLFDTIVYQLIAAFFFGLSFYDFALERYAKGVFSTIGFAFSNPLGMVITGLLFLGIYNIPYIGIPIAPVLTVMISTVAYAYYTKALPKGAPETTVAKDE